MVFLTYLAFLHACCFHPASLMPFVVVVHFVVVNHRHDSYFLLQLGRNVLTMKRAQLLFILLLPTKAEYCISRSERTTQCIVFLSLTSKRLSSDLPQLKFCYWLWLKLRGSLKRYALTLEALRGGDQIDPPSWIFGFKFLLLDRTLAQLFVVCEHIFWH